MSDINNIEKNSATIKTLQDSKSKITSIITNLAQDSCISLKYNKNAKKGENTWTGKLKKIKDLDLREGRINGYNIDTCKGMQQVADISMSAILKALNNDESEWADMVAEQRKKLSALTEENDGLREAFRILLQENLDLRDTMQDKNLLKDANLCDLDNIVNTYVLGRKKENEEENTSGIKLDMQDAEELYGTV